MAFMLYIYTVNYRSPMNIRTRKSSYAELTCLSNFSFLQAASHPQELVRRAAKLGYQALALTDECSLAGMVRAYEEVKRCQQAGYGLRLICGSQFRLNDGSRLVLLAPTKDAYSQLCTLITRGRRQAKKGSYRLEEQQFEQGLSHCLALWLPQADAVGEQDRSCVPPSRW